MFAGERWGKYGLYQIIRFPAINIVNPEPCIFCLGIFGSLLLIALFASMKHFIYVLFAIAMIVFALRIWRSRLRKEKSWRLMSVGAILFALWNGWAFFGHILVMLIPKGDFSRGSHGLKSILALHSPIDVLYYLFKMDHLLCFPALLFFYLALKRMTAQPANPAGDENNPP